MRPADTTGKVGGAPPLMVRVVRHLSPLDPARLGDHAFRGRTRDEIAQILPLDHGPVLSRTLSAAEVGSELFSDPVADEVHLFEIATAKPNGVEAIVIQFRDERALSLGFGVRRTLKLVPLSPLQRLRRAGAKGWGIALALIVLSVPVARSQWPTKVRLLADMPLEVGATPIRHFARSSGETGPTRFGKLTFRGGLVLTSPNAYFGGWSGLALDAQGRRLLAISDTGSWLTAELRYDGAAPAGITDARIGPLRDLDGLPFARGRDRDSEGLAVVAGTLDRGEALIAFEQNHRIGRFAIGRDGVGPLQGYLPVPAETAQMWRNTGLESVCRLGGDGPLAGSVVTLAERFPDGEDHVGWIAPSAGPTQRSRAPGGDWRRLALVRSDNFDLTDCHGLPDGGMLVLERRFYLRDWLSGPKMQLRRFTAAELSAGRASGAPMRGEVLITAGAAHEIDNMEGLAVHTGPAGEIVVSMISDDNFNYRLQRNVLLQFALEP